MGHIYTSTNLVVQRVIDIGKSIILLDDCMISYTVRIHNKINHQFEFIKDKMCIIPLPLANMPQRNARNRRPHAHIAAAQGAQVPSEMGALG